MDARSHAAWITDDTSTADLFAAYRAILRTLRDRGVIRTGNAPTGDYAEHLAAHLLSGTLAANSVKSFDVEARGIRYQVKARVLDGLGRGKLQLSPFRSWDFDHAVIVLFADDYDIERAAIVPVEALRAQARFRSHINGHVVVATSDLLERGRDVTADLRQVALLL